MLLKALARAVEQEKTGLKDFLFTFNQWAHSDLFTCSYQANKEEWDPCGLNGRCNTEERISSILYIYIYIMASKLRRECILENVSLDHMKFTLFFSVKKAKYWQSHTVQHKHMGFIKCHVS